MVASADCASRIVCSNDTGSSSARLSRSIVLVSSLTSPRHSRRSQGVARALYLFFTLPLSRLRSTSWNEGWKWFTYNRIAPYRCAIV